MAEITINQEYIVKLNATIETNLTDEEIENLIPTIPEVFKEMIIEEMTGGVGTVDVEPVKHGHWICMGDCGVTKCSCCGWTIEEYIEDKYCRDCGAKMDGKEVQE